MLLAKLITKAAIGGLTLIGFSLLSQSAQAAVLVNAIESGNDVIFSGGGTLNVSGLGTPTTISGSARGMNASSGVLRFLPTFVGPTSRYAGLSGPSNFGTSGVIFGSNVIISSSSGDIFGVNMANLSLDTSVGYVSGNSLTASMTFANKTFATLGLTPGTYVWNWGTGGNADTFTLNIGSAAVPEPLTILGAATAAGFGAAFKRRSNKGNKK